MTGKGVQMNPVARTLIEFVRIDSESGQEEEFILHLAELLASVLGARCERDAFGNLIGRLDPVRSSRRDPILFCVHADTVSPGRGIQPVVADGVVRSSGTTVLGSDDKAGIAELFHALQRAHRRPPVEILVTREEEVGLRGAKNADLTRIHARTAYVIDGADLDTVVVGGPSLISLDIAVHGRAAHAGMRPEEGVSALQVAAIAMASLPLGRVDPETTCNVGRLRGGTARNAIPAFAEIEAECRSLDHERCVALGATIEQAFRNAADRLGASVEVTRELCYQASRVPGTSKVVRVAVAALCQAGLTPKLKAITGGTDALILANRGLEAVVLGMGNHGSHTTEEHITVDALETGTSIIAGLLEMLA
jgi:tripeptide aminopeptidase